MTQRHQLTGNGSAVVAYTRGTVVPVATASQWNSSECEGRIAGWRWAALAAGSAVALCLTAPENSTVGRNRTSCSLAEAVMEPQPQQQVSAETEGALGIATTVAAPAATASAPPLGSSSSDSVNPNRQSQVLAESTAGAAAATHVQARRHSNERKRAGTVALSLASEYNANGPIEDRHDVRESPRGDFFASVYDGHGGWQAAEFARKRLNISAQTELNNSLAKTPEQVKGALTHAFLRVEREYLYRVKTAFELGFGAVAKTGSCALMALIRDDRLFVANAGDCRAVLGRRRKSSLGGWGSSGGEGVMEAVALSNDHNAREKTEQDKLRRLHPSEEDIVKCKRSNACYVKGRLQVIFSSSLGH